MLIRRSRIIDEELCRVVGFVALKYCVYERPLDFDVILVSVLQQHPPSRKNQRLGVRRTFLVSVSNPPDVFLQQRFLFCVTENQSCFPISTLSASN